MVSKSLFKIMALWLSFKLCTAEEANFPYPVDDDEFVELQYIVEVEDNNKGQQTKQDILNGIPPGNSAKFSTKQFC